MPALIFVMTLQTDGFFDRPSVDFWGTRRCEPPAPSETLFHEAKLPPELRELLDRPSPENARKYLSAEAERLRRLRNAIEAVQAEAARQIRVEVFTIPDCPACIRQRAELQAAPWPVKWLPAQESIESYPTIVIRGPWGARTLTGFQSLDSIRKSIEGDRRD